MCKVTSDNKLRVIHIMLSGDVLIYYTTYLKQWNSYEDEMSVLQECYNNAAKRSKILIKWQSMRFTEELINNTNDSEVKVFRITVAKLILLQKQIDRSYHSNGFPRDGFMAIVGTLSV